MHERKGSVESREPREWEAGAFRWARERARMDAAALAERFPQYEQWESGAGRPTFKQLEKLARKTMTPFGYFFLPEPPEEELPIPNFRTLGDRAMFTKSD